MSASPWQVYMVRCSDDTLYTGVTNHLDRRLDAHNAGQGAKYTRCRLPVELVYSESALSHGDALRRELALKRLTRAQKLALISTKKNT